MARYYQTGTASSPSALHDIIAFFMENTLSWTKLDKNNWEKKDGNVADNYHYETSYWLKGGRYFFMSNGYQDYDNYFSCGALEGWVDSGSGTLPYSYFNQTGYGGYAHSNDMAGPFTKYHLFGGQEGVDGDYMYCVVETTAGKFTHFGMGYLNRIGSIPCPFYVGTYWNMSTSYWRNASSDRHQRMFDSSSARYALYGGISFHQNTTSPTTEHYKFGGVDNYTQLYGGSIGGMNGEFFGDGPNAMNGRSILMPNHIRLNDGTGWYRIIGMAPAFRSIDIERLQPEDIVDTDWMVFPVKAKNTTTGANSGNYGWAYKFQGV